MVYVCLMESDRHSEVSLESYNEKSEREPVGRNLKRELRGAPNFFIFFARNPLKSPEFGKIIERK